MCLYVVTVTDAVPAAVDQTQDAAAAAGRSAQAQASLRVEQTKAKTVSSRQSWERAQVKP